MPLTETGYDRPILTEIADEILSEERGTISAQLDGSESSAIGNINTIFADQLAQGFEVLEEAINNFDPDNATDSRLVAIGLLTGVLRRGAQKGLVTTTVNLDAAKTFAAGDLVAHVQDDPDNRWVNKDEVTSTTSGNYSAVFEAETAGADFFAAAGTLTVIASPVDGWNSITNAADATEGTDEEDIEDFRLRRDASTAASGSGTVDAIRADLISVTGVLQVRVNENVTDAAVGDLPAHSFQAVIWDGSTPAADDDEIAQAIYDTRPTGIVAAGTESGTAVTAQGAEVTLAFARATAKPVYIDVEVVSSVGVSIADVRAAILAEFADGQVEIGDDVVIKRIEKAVMSLDGVDDLTFVQIGFSPGPVGTVNLSVSDTEIATFSSGDITVTGDAS